MAATHLDIIAGDVEDGHRLGRVWLWKKGEKQGMSLDFSSLPLPGQQILLVNKEGFDLSGFVSAFSLSVKISKQDKDGKEAKEYWQPLGDVLIHEAGYKVVFKSMPLTGSLVAFGKDN